MRRSCSVEWLLAALLVSASAACSGADMSSDDGCDCAAEGSCVDGRCVTSCALSPELAAAIAPELDMVRSFCVELDAGPLAALQLPDGELELVHVRVTTVGRETRMAIESRRSIASASSLAPTGDACAVTYTAPGDSVVTWLTSEVALSADARRIAWGLAAEERIGDSRRGIDGAVYALDRDGCEPEVRPFHRPTSVAFDADARLLVSGHLGGGVWMDGVFAGEQRVWADSGPGSVWRVPSGILVGTVLGHGVQPIVALSIESLRAGGEVPRSAALTSDAGQARFVYVGARGIVSSELALDAEGATLRTLELRSVQLDASALEIGAPVTVAQGPFLEAVAIQGSDRFLLRHAGGLVMVE